MNSVRKTYLLPEDLTIEMDDSIPKRKHSKYVAEAVAEKLKKDNREKLIDLIENTPLEDAVEDSVETVRKIRQEETDKLINNS